MKFFLSIVFFVLNAKKLKWIHTLQNLSLIHLNEEIEDHDIFIADVPWHYDRLDEEIGLNNQFNVIFPKELDENYFVFVIDTGIQDKHVAFKHSIVEEGIDVSNSEQPLNSHHDCNGHGTHVASLITGIIPKSIIIPVVVTDCFGKGTLSSLAEGIYWIIEKMKFNKGKKFLCNISLQSVKNEYINMLVNKLYEEGCLSIVAAGNYRAPACLFSPASVQSSITVGGTSMDDSIYSLSNYGSCVDIYAPADKISAADYLHMNSFKLKTGTSMATALVTGVLLSFWLNNPSLTKEVLKDYLLKEIAIKIPFPSIDVDCNGYVEPNARFLQLYSKRTEDEQSYSISNKDYDYWSPKWILKPNDCYVLDIMFNGKINKRRKLSVGILTSVKPLIMGLDLYSKTSFMCKTTSLEFNEITLHFFISKKKKNVNLKFYPKYPYFSMKSSAYRVLSVNSIHPC